jgi:hypothetical protein
MMLRLACAVAVAATTAAQAGDRLAGSTPIVPSALSANVSVYAGAGRTSPVGSDPWDIATVAGEIHVGARIGTLGIQGDLWGGDVRYTFADDSVRRAQYAGTGIHVNLRLDDGMIGGLISVGVSPGGYNATFLNTALEAQTDFGSFTLGAQAGYTQTVSTSATSAFSLEAPDSWYVHGIARWFANEDLMLSGDAGLAGFSDSVGQSGDVWRWGGRLEHKLNSTPVSIFVAYQGYRWSQQSMLGVMHGVMVGLTLIGGDDSLAARYRGTAGLDDRNIFYGVNNPP